MPVEIKELHIRITVNAPAGTGHEPAAASSSPPGGAAIDKEALLAECIDQVLSILQEKQER